MTAQYTDSAICCKVYMVNHMKLIATYSLKVTEKIKAGLDQLNPMQKYQLNEQIKDLIKRAIHNSRYDPAEFE